jgi:hypothetical protein
MSRSFRVASCQSTLAGILLCTATWAGPVSTQQLEPRAFAPNPVGINFVSLSTGYTEGDVMLDASSPIQDFEVELNDVIAGYARSFAAGSRLASVAVAVPYVTGEATGLVNGEPRQAPRSGFGDLRARFTLHLLRDSAMDMRRFATEAPDRTLGLSLVVVAPTGEYFDDRLVNIGANRWALKPELGGMRQFGRWTVDGSIGAWLFEDNDDYLGGCGSAPASPGTRAASPPWTAWATTISSTTRAPG